MKEVVTRSNQELARYKGPLMTNKGTLEIKAVLDLLRTGQPAVDKKVLTLVIIDWRPLHYLEYPYVAALRNVHLFTWHGTMRT